MVRNSRAKVEDLFLRKSCWVSTSGRSAAGYGRIWRSRTFIAALKSEMCMYNVSRWRCLPALAIGTMTAHVAHCMWQCLLRRVAHILILRVWPQFVHVILLSQCLTEWDCACQLARLQWPAFKKKFKSQEEEPITLIAFFLLNSNNLTIFTQDFQISRNFKLKAYKSLWMVVFS